MTTALTEIGAFHYALDASAAGRAVNLGDAAYQFEYTFQNFFHPFVGDLIKRLNLASVAGMLDPSFLGDLSEPFDYQNPAPNPPKLIQPEVGIDLIGGPYANYNWELLYHIPVMIAVHLSNNQRFAEAQKWFHYVFDPTCTDTNVPTPQRFWKFLAFRNEAGIQNINSLLELLSNPDGSAAWQAVNDSYNAMLYNPFHPHAVARTRQSAYQWYGVMKYLDNLIAWGDSLFLQDTIETINEATLCYVLAADILGPRPQAVPPRGVIAPKNYLQLKQAGVEKDPMGNAMVELEAQFSFNMVPGADQTNAGGDQSGALFGVGRTLYFCTSSNQTLLAYWDTVADRLFKIRNSENIQGVVQQLPLFDPPLDPAMLVKAAAAGIDIGSIISGLNQPLGPVRAPLLIQKAQELAAEVRSLGNALLTSLEKGDAEQLALKRQSHEVELQQQIQNVRYIQWRHARETTNGLLKTRASALERYTYYLRLLGATPDPNTVPPDFTLDQGGRDSLDETNFDDFYQQLVGQYDKSLMLKQLPNLQLAGDTSPGILSGFSGSGQIYLSHNEDVELNVHLPVARDATLLSSTFHSVAATLAPIPDAKANLHFWGLGGTIDLKIGTLLSNLARIAGDISGITSAWERDQAVMASKFATYQRRADDWMFQVNLAARELTQIGRQIIASLIAEQIAYHDYLTVKTQVQQAQDIESFLQTKFTNKAFYDWQISQLTGLYYQYYRFACDIARKAEQTMKRELMRPELDTTSFIQFNYWDSGHQGLLSGEALVLDIKRMEMAYHDNNKRELELTRHISLRQLDPLALLVLKITGSCTASIPEWLYDLDCPGLYLRRIKSVAVSVPCVVGPYTSINCTLSLQRSTLRVSPLLRDNVYGRDTSGEDDRFVDYFGGAEAIVTSSAANDSGMFETNLKDERFLPFEGAGAVSTWTLSLPPDLRSFDYMTISDVILHIRYTAREAGDPLGSQATKELKTMLASAGQSSPVLVLNLRYDFPTEWSAFVNGAANANFTAMLQKDFFPYLAQTANQLSIDKVALYAASGNEVVSATPPNVGLGLPHTFSGPTAPLSLPTDGTVLTQDPSRQVFLGLQYHFSI
jgi:hypothetical protein